MVKWRPLRRVGPLAAVIALMIGCAACVPSDFVQPTAARPTQALFVPDVVAPDPALSPLQPVSPLPAPPTPMATVEAPDQAPDQAPDEATVEATAQEPAEPETAPSEVSGPSLMGPTWEWVSSIFTDGLALATDDPARYTVQFGADGNAIIQADCNFGSGIYEVTGDRLKFDAIGTTKMACPPDSFDSEFLGQLYNLDRYEFEDGALVLYLLEEAGSMRFRAAPGEVGEIAEAPAEVVATPEPAAAATAIPQAPTSAPTETAPATAQPLPAPITSGESLADTRWAVTSLTIDGQPAALQPGSEITLIVNPDGAVISGSTGCNQYRARLASGEGGLAVQAPALLSRKSCPSAISLQEVEFMESLLHARSWVVQDGELLLLGADDATLMALSMVE